jgi:hypothetical protein
MSTWRILRTGVVRGWGVPPWAPEATTRRRATATASGKSRRGGHDATEPRPLGRGTATGRVHRRNQHRNRARRAARAMPPHQASDFVVRPDSPLRPELFYHALELHLAVEALDHIRARARVLGQQEHGHAGDEAVRRRDVPNRPAGFTAVMPSARRRQSNGAVAGLRAPFGSSRRRGGARPRASRGRRPSCAAIRSRSAAA